MTCIQNVVTAAAVAPVVLLALGFGGGMYGGGGYDGGGGAGSGPR